MNDKIEDMLKRIWETTDTIESQAVIGETSYANAQECAESIRQDVTNIREELTDIRRSLSFTASLLETDYE